MVVRYTCLYYVKQKYYVNKWAGENYDEITIWGINIDHTVHIVLCKYFGVCVPRLLRQTLTVSFGQLILRIHV